MLRENSPTLQRMIASVTPGDGNMQTAPVQTPEQFKSPYPSPKDMVMQAGINPGYPTPMMYGFQTPANTITMINGVPTELEYRPHEMNPIVPPPGRYMGGNSSGSIYGQSMLNTMNQQPNIIGGFSGYNTQMSIPQNIDNNIYGAVDIYYGEMIHPHINAGWYGTTDFPFEQNSKTSLNQNTMSNLMRDKFNEKFPGYATPVNPGYNQQPVISQEVRDMANIAAFYGMSYNEFIENGSKMMKIMSRHANKYLGRSDEEIRKRQDIYNIKYPNKTSMEPDNDNDLFYPNGAFDYRGQLTREYQGMFCVNKDLSTKLKTMKVVVVKNGEEIECKPRVIDFSRSRELLDRWTNSDNSYRNWLEYNRNRFANQYWQAPERQFDHIDGNVFEVTSSALAYAEQKELEEKLRYQNYTRTSSIFNKADFISTIKGIRERSKANARMIEQQKWDELVHKVAGNQTVPGEVPQYGDRPYICDGDWIIAKPGVDIIGVPIDKSVNKIIRMNTVTEEEEIYDPGKMTGLDVRERIIESLTPTFAHIDDNETANRLERFKNSGFDM